MHEWVNLPRVATFWDGASSKEGVRQKYFSPQKRSWFFPYIVTAEGQPCAYVLAYHDSAREDSWWGNYHGDIWGVDLFIAIPLWQGHGLGPKILRKMVARLRRQHHVIRIFADPAPENSRSVRAFEKAFFKEVAKVDTPDGLAVLMEFTGATPATSVELRAQTAENYQKVIGLTVAPDQRRFVANNAVSLAQASFSPGTVVRGVFAGEIPVGFLMLRLDDEDFKGLKTKGQPELWRFMIAEEYQGYGYGKRAMELVLEEVKSWPGATALYLSYVEGDGTAAGFYQKCGYRETGFMAEWEHIMVRDIH